MPIDHSKCSHPRTPAGRRACRARHEGMTDSRDLSTTPMGVKLFERTPRVSRETTRDRSDEIAPTRAMAELLGMRAPERPDTPSFLTTDAYIRNDGFIAPGHDWKAASTGRKGSTNRKVKKDTAQGNVERDDIGNVINDKGRTGLPVTTPGIYLHPGTGIKYQVKLGRESRKPFAVTLEGEYAKGIIFELRAADKIDEVAIPGLGLSVPTTPAKLDEGFYQYNDKIYRVKHSRSSGFPFALLIDDENPRGVYVPGVVKSLTADMKLTREFAAEYGIRTGNCCICGRELTRTESIERGIGPVCLGKMGW